MMAGGYLALVAVEPEAPAPPFVPFVPVDRTAEVEARHRRLQAEHVATWGEPGRGCGCARCRAPAAPRSALPASIRRQWLAFNGVKPAGWGKVPGQE